MTTTKALDKVGDVTIDYAAVLKTLNLDPRDPNVQALVLTCQSYELDPVLKHMILIKGNPYVTHKGLWHIAHRSGLLDGHEIVEEGDSGNEWFAKVAIYRKDWSRPVTMKGRYAKAGTNKQYGQEMAVTRAECLVLRRLFDVALPVYEEINWSDRPARADEPVDDRGAGGVTSNGRTVAVPSEPRPSSTRPALPPPNVDATTGEILESEPTTVREAQQAQAATNRRFAPPSQSAQNTRRIMADFADADATKAYDALKVRKQALSEAAAAQFKGDLEGINLLGFSANSTKDEFEQVEALLASAELMDAS